MAFFAATSAATCAANGVDFFDPANPLPPLDAQQIVLPDLSQTVTIVLLKVAWICAIALGMFLATFFFVFFFLGLCSSSFFSSTILCSLMRLLQLHCGPN